jgi:hypothetical protein
VYHLFLLCAMLLTPPWYPSPHLGCRLEVSRLDTSVSERVVNNSSGGSLGWDLDLYTASARER